ncbi:hypothetical protein BC835DRAFT_1541450 [Cytidiella melzeri]|nr:hypothetical protein BC835DRAFT_1541450 [Cytidiella melzeri]
MTPTKCPRIDTEREFAHDTSIWMSDGNLVIAVEDPGDDLEMTYAFKCHMSVLAKHSTVFEALFTLPQSPDQAETYDGVPLVVLPDPYPDVKELLQMLYDPSRLPYPCRRATEEWLQDVFRVSRVFQLVAKYELNALRDRLKDVLETFWPETLKEWTDKEDTVQELRRHDTSVLPRPNIAIRIGYDAGVPSILPAAFYNLHVMTSRLPMDMACCNLNADGSNYAHSQAGWQLANLHDSPLSNLGVKEIAQLMQGRDWLWVVVTNLISEVIRDALTNRRCALREPGSILKKTCYPATDGILGRYRDARDLRELCDDPLDGLILIKKRFRDQTMCQSCRKHVCKIFDAFRQYIWDELPYFFGIKSRKEGELYGYKRYLDKI